MGKIVEKQKRKKKGRPSLLDLQKRTLKEQQQQLQQKQHRNISNSNSATRSSSNYKSATPTPSRRSTRRNPTPSSPDTLPDEDDDAELDGKRRREKKLKLVLKLPSSQKSDPNSASANSNGSDSNGEEDKNTASNQRKRKINAIADGSVFVDSEKGGKSTSGANPTSNVQDWGPSTPLPDKKLLLFILDRLQKKDTYGVFSEPVDLEELPDYLEVIEHPMDFGTVRKKLSSGAYANLEQFEETKRYIQELYELGQHPKKDVFLICSNAMQYNAPDTIYFRQARSIQELAKKNFENLRQDSDDNEPEPKVVRRGRPPTVNFKKQLGRPSLDRAVSEFSSDATLATGGENNIWSNHDLRKGPHLSDKSGSADLSGRFHGSRTDAYWLTENKLDRNDEATGSILKGSSMKHGKKQFAVDERRRNSYNQFHLSAGGREPSVLATFDAERKHLMAVGLFSEYGYARSLARFAANIGPVAWRIASKRIERSLPPGVTFGPGWVKENDIPPQRPLLLSSPPPCQQSSVQHVALLESSSAAATPCTVESKEEKLSTKPKKDNMSEKQVPSFHSVSEERLSNPLPRSASISTSVLAASKSEPHTERAEVEGVNSQAGFDMPDSTIGMMRSRPPFQIHQNPGIQPGMNGFNGTYGYNLPAHLGKLTGAPRAAGLSILPSQMVDTISKTNTNLVHSANSKSLNSENPKPPQHSRLINSSGALPNSGSEAMEAPRSGLQPRPSWHGLPPQPKQGSALSTQQKSDSVPPDLNVRFQSPGSPSSSRVDSTQPDLVLQL